MIEASSRTARASATRDDEAYTLAFSLSKTSPRLFLASTAIPAILLPSFHDASQLIFTVLPFRLIHLEAGMIGPNSRILVILDEEAEPTCCFELCKSHQLDSSPFPQNKKIELQYGNDAGRYVAFIPVLGQPLSSNRYYALKAQGRHKGLTFRNSLEGDVVTCCFCRCFPDIEPQLADHHDIYQQFEICPKKRGGFFVAKLMAPDGVPSKFLRRNGWQALISAPRSFTLGEASVLDNAL
ncbi:hypothetical protein Gotri_000846 [Gossypium trilobum]|uniref:Uncharacterized protein n=1 Tax=Gossypium trilobum TaxID=34281 RepID=A0A7J9FDL8_9ROSI|nr:hypothetical protein [Gossypium trilobum]